MTSCFNRQDDDYVDDSEIRYRYFNLQNNGWKSKTQTQEVDEINFTATEVPIVYYLLKNNQNGQDLIKVDSLYELNKTERVIEFNFVEDSEEDLLQEKFTGMEYQNSVEYLSFTIAKDFYLVTSKNDTVTCEGVLFERDFKSTPNHKLMLFFSGISPNEKIQLVYKDYLFNKGTLKFRFKEPIINL
ncbi:hypothetical protein GCM10022386_01570 [Flavobacterium cheonhonense]|uniref:Lipoprotein n=1 Tax=Flavobacterium cheonhonense TaxID=706185 RepID=A0ABP7T7T9_9FLAO|nr:hypothetical protein [Flavobacterium cheonhonense]